MNLTTIALAATLATSGASGYNTQSGEHSVAVPDYDPARITIYNIESGSTTIVEIEQTEEQTNGQAQQPYQLPYNPNRGTQR